MSAIVATVLKGTIGLLIKKGLKRASEKLKDGDVTDQQLQSWIMDETDNVKSKLDAMARKDLGASISFFREGLVLLDKAMDARTRYEGGSKNAKGANQVKSSTKVSPEAAKKGRFWSKWFSSVASPTKSLVDQGKNELSLVTRELDAEAIFDAKKRFEDARRKATEAFNNEVLSPLDRILAMGVRLMATILEKVETPVSTLDACISGLNELHSMPFVTENFSVEIEKGIKSRFSKVERRQIISSVCQINRTIYDFTLLVGSEECIIFWPCIETGQEKVDPLRDSRVANMLCKQEISDCSIAWSFGQEGAQELQNLKSAVSIATNTLGQFLVADSTGDECVKIFDATGKFVKSFSPTEDKRIIHNRKIIAVGTDNDDNIYVLMTKNEKAERVSMASMLLFNHHAQFKHHFTFDVQFEAVTTKATDSGFLLVPGHLSLGGRTTSKNVMANADKHYAMIVDKRGNRMDRLCDDTLGRIRDIAVADECVMVLDWYSSNVFVFADKSSGKDYRPTSSCQEKSRRCKFHVSGNDKEDLPLSRFSKIRKFPVGKVARAITFHPRSKQVIIASQTKDDRSQLMFYSTEGKFERSIDLNVERGYLITGAAVTMEGRICVAASNFLEEKGKILVL